jgi:hypothetical protein
VKPKHLRGLLDLAGGAAVLIGLIFVGLELRQNTEAIEAASLQSQADASTEFLLLIASDNELSRIWFESSKSPNELSEFDSYRYFIVGRARWVRMQTAYLQWRRGALGDEDWLVFHGRICGEGRFKATWEDHRTAMLDEFVEFVESCWSSTR